MADHINRDLALEAINDLSRNAEYDSEAEKRGWNNAIELAVAAVEKIPTADVRTKKHGRWIEEGDVVVCSECGEEHAWDSYRATYCEDCGAKMDWEEGESGWIGLL